VQCPNNGHASTTGNQHYLFIGCTFRNLVAPSTSPKSNRGGAIFVVASTTSLGVNGSCFENNSAQSCGGAIFFEGISFKSVQNAYLSNKAEANPTYHVGITSESNVKDDQIAYSSGPSETNGNINAEFFNSGTVIIKTVNISFSIMAVAYSDVSSYLFYYGIKGKLARVSIINNSCGCQTIDVRMTNTTVAISFSNFVLNYEIEYDIGLLISYSSSVLTARECCFLYNTAYALFYNSATFYVINVYIGLNSIFLVTNGVLQLQSFLIYIGTINVNNVHPEANNLNTILFTQINIKKKFIKTK
jgi:hypothetical protein